MIDLDMALMVLIPSGSFVMGSSESEQGRFDDEGPQHQVNVPSFFMGRHPITQAQWEAVAALPMEKQSLEANPSRFKGENNPVEQVSWYDAVEFCARLSAHTQRRYWLPSEAQWEYACRAGTTSPFHFGETITTDLANYGGVGQATPVGQRRHSLPNPWGLHDMHGNVWEWCLDHWHDNYEGAPTDGSAWINEGKRENAARVIRGGSWIYTPQRCRSAYRNPSYPRQSSCDIGFRVVCSAPRTL